MIPIASIRRTLRRNVGRLSKQEAQSILIGHRGLGIHDPAYRALTGGYLSQSIAYEVSLALGRRASLRTPT
jgi:hypothetical protein